jgi:hypothetical protein
MKLYVAIDLPRFPDLTRGSAVWGHGETTGRDPLLRLATITLDQGGQLWSRDPPHR